MLFNVRNWAINRRSTILLLGVLLVIVLVLVLPQVDLLDTAFQLGTAPIVIHSVATGNPVFQILSMLFAFFLTVAGIVGHRCLRDPSPIRIYKIEVLNHSFRC
jgi:hypothetical protein